MDATGNDTLRLMMDEHQGNIYNFIKVMLLVKSLFHFLSQIFPAIILNGLYLLLAALEKPIRN